ncbi:MAG: flagellar hook-basal body complex protein FliE [Ruminococcus sp.]|nr:flagellar hook-basal body complex protein FliE [Ruminococcus sp.]MBR6599132.1 flagellar hook-basal body complex protein FliE [Oscillospiraceae bacterium]
MINNMFITPLVQMPTIAELGGSAKYSGIDVKTDDSEMSFADTLGKKIAEIKSLEQKSLDSAYAVAMGQTEDIEGAMIDATKASVAIETAVQITTRAVNAYKEIMQMQI